MKSTYNQLLLKTLVDLYNLLVLYDIDFYLNAYPIIKKYGVTVTSFIPTGLVGSPAYMTWSQIEEINRDGLVHFEAHSVTHPNLNGLPLEEVRVEIAQSKSDLEKHTGKIVNWFAYPYGKYRDVVVKEVQLSGFVGAVTTVDGVYQSPDELYTLKRRSVDNIARLETFKAKL